jgi:hypothetical protein
MRYRRKHGYWPEEAPERAASEEDEAH